MVFLCKPESQRHIGRSAGIQGYCQTNVGVKVMLAYMDKTALEKGIAKQMSESKGAGSLLIFISSIRIVEKDDPELDWGEHGLVL